MKKNNILLKTLLMSTSSLNIFRYTTDKKKKGKIVGAFFGLLALYAMLMFYFIAACVGYGKIGIIDSVPVLCSVSISMLAFFSPYSRPTDICSISGNTICSCPCHSKRRPWRRASSCICM